MTPAEKTTALLQDRHRALLLKWLRGELPRDASVIEVPIFAPLDLSEPRGLLPGLPRCENVMLRRERYYEMAVEMPDGSAFTASGRHLRDNMPANLQAHAEDARQGIAGIVASTGTLQEKLAALDSLKWEVEEALSDVTYVPRTEPYEVYCPDCDTPDLGEYGACAYHGCGCSCHERRRSNGTT